MVGYGEYWKVQQLSQGLLLENALADSVKFRYSDSTVHKIVPLKLTHTFEINI